MNKIEKLEKMLAEAKAKETAPKKPKAVKNPKAPKGNKKNPNAFFFSMDRENRVWLKKASQTFDRPQSEILKGLLTFARKTSQKQASQIFGK